MGPYSDCAPASWLSETPDDTLWLASECASKVIVRRISFAIGEISDRSWQDGDSDVGDDEYYSGHDVSGFGFVHSSQNIQNVTKRPSSTLHANLLRSLLVSGSQLVTRKVDSIGHGTRS